MTEFRLLRFARTLCLIPPLLLRGEVLFVGDVGSEGATLLNICADADSIVSLIRRVRVDVPGVIDSPAVFRRFVFGAGVKSSTPLPLAAWSLSSSSEHSTTTRRRVAARLAGREGDTAGISGEFVLQHSFEGCSCRCCDVYFDDLDVNKPW